MITSVKPMSVDHARALAQAYELERLLKELCDRPEHPEGSPVWQAWNWMDEVIGLLEPLEPGELEQLEEKSARDVRLLVTAPREYEAHKRGQAMRRMACKPWRRS